MAEEGKDTEEEKRLIHEALLGGPAGKLAFTEYARKKEPVITGLIMPVLKKKEDVEEVFWRALHQVWQALGGPNPPRDVHTVLVTAALNLARTRVTSLHWRRGRERARKEADDRRENKRLQEAGRERPEDEGEGDAGEEVNPFRVNPEQALARAEEIDKVKKLTKETFKDEPIFRKILDCKYRLDMRHDEIGWMLGISEDEVRTRLQTAKRRLLPLLRKELGIDTPATILQVVPDPEPEKKGAK